MRTLKDKHQTLNGGADSPSELCVMATGGGAYKYYDMIREVLGADVLREDEMECLIIGKKFFVMGGVVFLGLLTWPVGPVMYRAGFLHH